MALSTQDFNKGVDLTGIDPAAASDFNNLVDQANPHSDGGYNGKGILLVTQDTSLNTPDVPNPVGGTTKWKRYLWVRLPFSLASAFQAPIVYAWNDLIVADMVYLKWLKVTGDLVGIQNQINALTASLAVTDATANNAYALASAVNGIATAAQATANAANTTANNASAAAASATATANATAAQLTTVQTDITNATNTANSASTAAAAAQTAVNAFLAAQNYAIIAETAAQNTDLGAINIGANQVQFNSEVYDANNIVSLAAGKFTLINAGTYLIEADIPAHIVNDRVQAWLVHDADNAVLAYGNSTSNQDNVNEITLFSHIKRIITVIANTVIRVDLHSLQGHGLRGKASNLSVEYYSVLKIQQIA